MRDNKKNKGVSRSQMSMEEIQAKVEYNRRIASDGKSRKKFGAKSQIQHNKIEEEESSAESLWNSLSSASDGSSDGGSSFGERRKKRQPQKSKPRSRML